MRAIAVIAVLGVLGASAAVHADPKVASGPVKAYRGPEGEQIVMVEVDDGKQVLVQMRKIGGALDGKTVLYRFEDRGRGDKTIYIEKKRGSKTYRSQLLEARDNRWQFYHPTNPKVQFGLRYSQSDSEAIRFEDVLKTYNP